MGGLRKGVGVGEKNIRRAGCANKRGIYKWKWFICESGWGGEKLRCAPVHFRKIRAYILE